MVKTKTLNIERVQELHAFISEIKIIATCTLETMTVCRTSRTVRRVESGLKTYSPSLVVHNYPCGMWTIILLYQHNPNPEW